MPQPIYPAPLVPYITAPIAWNNVKAGDTICVTRFDHTLQEHFLGTVMELERLPNCYMMHLEIHECFEGDYSRVFTINHFSWLQVFFGAGPKNQDPVVRWKKPPGSSVMLYDKASWDALTPTQRGNLRPYSGNQNTGANNWTPPPPPNYKKVHHSSSSVPSLDDVLKGMAGKRQQYVAARNMLTQARSEVDDYLQFLGINRNVTREEFTALRRRCMREWHPDRIALAGARGISAEEFKNKSEKYTNAFARIEQVLFPREVAQFDN